MGLFARLFARPQEASRRDWHVVVDGVVIARLRGGCPDDMFWRSFEIVALTRPIHAGLDDDAFWLGDAWRLVDARTGAPQPGVVASAAGLADGRRRVPLRGFT